MDEILTEYFALLPLAFATAPVLAQERVEPPVLAAPPVFTSGTGDGTPALPVYVKPPRPQIDCALLGLSAKAISYGYYGSTASPKQRLDGKLFTTAVEKFRKHHCAYGRNAGPAVIVVVDFAKHSREPRLYRVDLRDGDGLDRPMVVAHGIGSDPDDDGYATVFSNVYNSFASSLGAAIGAERYIGINGLSLRLDGLDPSNNQMRYRDIVVHSYAPERRRYFNAEYIANKGRPGSSEGCFVVEPDKRELILETLENGGFIYAGYSGELPKPIIPIPNANVTFAQGTGATPASAFRQASETRAEMPGNPPTAPILPAPATPMQ